MKKSLVFMIAVLLVGALMISCNGDVSNNSDNLVTVSLKTDTSKGLSTTPSSNIADVDALYWYFTATKTDGSMFTTGATSTQTPVVSEGSTGLVGKFIGGENDKRLFSTGSWSFSFYGYKDYDSTKSTPYSNLVYKCEKLAVTITGNTELTLTLDTVSDSPAQLKLGSPAPYWRYNNAVAGTSLTLKIYDGSNLLATSTANVEVDAEQQHKATFTQLAGDNVSAGAVTLTPGIHSLDFEVWYGNEKVGKSTLNLNAKANNSYPVTGDIENLDATYWVKIISTTKAQVETNSLTNNEMSVAISPLSATTGASETSTTVNFTKASGDFANDGSTYSLAVDVLAGTGVSVSASSENVNVANIDLTLTKTTGTTVENVASFGDSSDDYVLVTTYIGKDLTNVKVNGVAATTVNEVTLNPIPENDAEYDAGISNVAYTQETGKLVFSTNHFSEFAVTSDAVATITNESTVYYSTLASAFDAAKTGDTIKLHANSATSVSYTVPAGKTLTVDFNGKTVTSSKVTTTVGDAGFLVNNGTLTFTDSTTGDTVGGVVSSNNNVVINNGTMTINKGSFKGNRNDITYANSNNNTRGVIYNSLAGNLVIDDIILYTAQDYGLLNMGSVVINDGQFDSDSMYKVVDTVEMMYGYCVTSYAGSMTINDGTVTGIHGGVGVNGGTGLINDVTVTTRTKTLDETYTGPSFYALYLAGEQNECTTTINGGTFTAAQNPAAYIGNKNDGGLGLHSSVVINGGSFIGGEDKQAINLSKMGSGYGSGDVTINAGTFENANHSAAANKVYATGSGYTLEYFKGANSTVSVSNDIYTVTSSSAQ